jgi:hypothetical protein
MKRSPPSIVNIVGARARASYRETAHTIPDIARAPIATYLTIVQRLANMTELCHRFAQNPILRPADVVPSWPDFVIDCLLNPEHSPTAVGSDYSFASPSGRRRHRRRR